MNKVQSGDYEDAIENLETIIDYKDAMQQIEIALERMYERDYNNAKEFIAEQKYSEALEILNNIENKDEVSELITLCDVALKYEKGVTLLEEKNYIEAIDLLTNNDFDINGEKINACYMGLAYQEISNKEYDRALEYFEIGRAHV